MTQTSRVEENPLGYCKLSSPILHPGRGAFHCVPKIVDGHTTLREFCFLSTGQQQRDRLRLEENV